MSNFNTWRDNVMSGYINFSPSYDSNVRKCAKKGVLETTIDIGNPHTQYGHAFGEALACIFEEVQLAYNRNEEPDQLYILGKALLCTVRHIKDFMDGFKGKGLKSMVEVLPIVYLNVEVMLEKYDYIDAERKVIAMFPFRHQGLDLRGFISGTYDVKLRHKKTKLNKILDAKAIASEFSYSFSTDPQILVYGLLTELVGEEVAPEGEYLAHIISGTHIFKRIELQLSMYLDYIPVYIKHMIDQAKKLAILAYESDADSFERKVKEFEFNPSACEPNGYKCLHFGICHGSESVGVKKYVDDRKPTQVIKLEISPDDLYKAGEAIQARAKAKLKSLHDQGKLGTSRSTVMVGCVDEMKIHNEVEQLFDI